MKFSRAIRPVEAEFKSFLMKNQTLLTSKVIKVFNNLLDFDLYPFLSQS